jgi:hypothetical protein
MILEAHHAFELAYRGAHPPAVLTIADDGTRAKSRVHPRICPGWRGAGVGRGCGGAARRRGSLARRG